MGVWLHSGAAVTGQSHVSTSVPCQDKFKIQASEDGEWLALVVSDGAGSAQFGEYGAEVTSTFFCRELLRLAQELLSRSPGQWINDFVIECVIRVRDQLRHAARSDNLRDYHCTLVAALVGKSGGFSIHIGDGAIFGGRFLESSSLNVSELNSSFFISKPENGEYANETFFITEGNWVKHLRVTPLPALDWIVACTDGGASLVLDGDNLVKPKFLAPFIQEQINNNFTDHSYVEKILSDPKANKLTTDDKTLLLAVRRGVLSAPVQLIFSAVQNSESPGHSKAIREDYDYSSRMTASTKIDQGEIRGVSGVNNAPSKLPEKKKFHRSTKPRKTLIIGLSLGLFLIVGGFLLHPHVSGFLGYAGSDLRRLILGQSLPTGNDSAPLPRPAESDAKSPVTTPQEPEVSPSK
jgi:hypothetical protein